MLLLSHYMLYNTLCWIMWYTIHLYPISFQFHEILQSFSISTQSNVSCWLVAMESIVAMVQFYGCCELINGLCEFTIISFNSGRFLWWLLAHAVIVAMTMIATVQSLPSYPVASFITQMLPWQCSLTWYNNEQQAL